MREKEFWYYEYVIKYFNEVDDIEETRHGIVPAESMVDALKEISEFYEKDLVIDVQMLKPVFEGFVFDFHWFKEDNDGATFLIQEKEPVNE